MKFRLALAATSLFVLLLAGVYYVHIAFFTVDVVFYAAIQDAIIAAALTAVVLFSVPLFCVLGSLEKAQLLVIWLLAGYAFAISVPTVIDRSLSFYILEKLSQRGGGIQQQRFEDVFTNEYMVEHRLVDVRLTEQLESGTIVIRNGCVQLTEKGKLIVGFSRFFRRNLLPRKRLLMGEYTDDLTDPFRHSSEAPDYTCE